MTTVSYTLNDFGPIPTVTWDPLTNTTTGGLQFMQYNYGYELFSYYPAPAGSPPGSFGQLLVGRDAQLLLQITPSMWLETYTPDRPALSGLEPWSRSGTVSPVPEPSAWILLLVALIAAAIWRHTRRATSGG